MQMLRFESFAPHITLKVQTGTATYTASRWRETIGPGAGVHARFETGTPAWISHDRAHYLATWPDELLLGEVLGVLCAQAGLRVRPTGPDLRLRRRAGLQFAFNYGPDPVDLAPFGAPAEPAAYRLGGPRLGLAGVAAWPV